ncbi:Metalloendopeptidase [Candidatus Desulfarcum epimagneticum]|uniref:Metalloendopeptidase n=1 Tax=uncultured Desulfobacteraceae bacterium TaxID=218296 RepID=A0A484HI49_9BACT|nr:Metalloendopeptidase [uncultured Desulfobacteraceae bacterium]
MMRKKFSFYILSNTGSPIKRTAASYSSLMAMGAAGAAFLVFFCYIIYGYFNLKSVSVDTGMLQREIQAQKTEIEGQRRQIERFTRDINSLKGKLADLKKFEKKIRIIANIEDVDKQDGLFGIGGSIPEDLDPKIALRENNESLLREMHSQTSHLKIASTRQEEDFESLLKHFEKQRNLLASTPAIWPVKGWVTSKFGYRKSPYTDLREFHKGLDIAARKGAPIISSANGVVSFAGRKGLLGKVVVIDHGHGMVTRYAHTDKILVKRFQKVKRGDVIALVGNTGRSTGPHLHYEVHLNGVPVNPHKYIMN